MISFTIEEEHQHIALGKNRSHAKSGDAFLYKSGWYRGTQTRRRGKNSARGGGRKFKKNETAGHRDEEKKNRV